MFKTISLSIVGVFLFFALICVLDYSGLMWESFIGPKRENVQRNIFENTKSYNQGMIQDLSKHLEEYNRSSDPIERNAIKSAVRQRFSDFDENKLNSRELYDFLKKCRYGI